MDKEKERLDKLRSDILKFLSKEYSPEIAEKALDRYKKIDGVFDQQREGFCEGYKKASSDKLQEYWESIEGPNAAPDPDEAWEILNMAREGFKFKYKQEWNHNVAYTKPLTHSPRGYKWIDIIYNDKNNWVLITEGKDSGSYDKWDTRFAGQVKNQKDLHRLLEQIAAYPMSVKDIFFRSTY